jgi:hypothetical protein
MKRILLFIAFLLISTASFAQKIPTYFSSDFGYLAYRFNTIDVDPGPNWKGHYLSDKDGFDFKANVGVILKERFNVGFGLSYLNFEGVNGLGSYADLGVAILKNRKFTPIVYWNIGYSHLWNQYAGGTGTLMSDVGLRLQYQISYKVAIHASTGFFHTQQSYIRPYRIGLVFR